MKYPFIIIISMLFTLKTGAQTVQGSIQNTGAPNGVLVVAKPSSTLTNVRFSNFSVAISIPHQTVTPTATILTNSIPHLSWNQVTDLNYNGRDYYIFLGILDVNNNTTVSWTAGQSSPVLNIQFSNGVGSQIVQLNDLTGDNGGASQQVYWYVEQLGVGDITDNNTPFYASAGSGAPVNIAGGNSFVPTGALVALPLQLLDFQASKPKDNAARLTWTTTNEAHFSHFDIEKSADGSPWKTIGSAPGKSAHGEKADYGFDDNTPFGGQNYYRLRMVDDDGSAAFSPVRALNFDQVQSVVVFPNPAVEGIWLQYPHHFSEETIYLRLLDIAGRLVLEEHQDIETNGLSYWLDMKKAGLAAGAFTLEISGENGWVERKVVVFQPK